MACLLSLSQTNYFSKCSWIILCILFYIYNLKSFYFFSVGFLNFCNYSQLLEFDLDKCWIFLTSQFYVIFLLYISFFILSELYFELFPLFNFYVGILLLFWHIQFSQMLAHLILSTTLAGWYFITFLTLEKLYRNL